VRIAFLCHRIPYPPNKGDKLRAFYELRAMAERGHDVDLFTLADDPADLEHQQALGEFCRSVTVQCFHPVTARVRSLAYLPTRKPLTLPYFYSAPLAAKFRTAIAERKYDRIFVYCSAMAQYAGPAAGIPVITDLVDVDSDKWRQYAGYARFPMSLIYRREAALLARYERTVCSLSAASIVATDREAELLRTICSGARVHVMANGLGEGPSGPRARATRPAVVFTGDMAYFPNAHAVEYFAHQVLPEVRKQAPGTRFLIVGRNPTRAVTELASLPGVEVTGTVPDVGKYLQQAQVSVAPFLISAGIPNKILEAMNYGLPVVATSRAIQGLAEEAARAVTTADEPADIASAVATLLRNPELAERTGTEGRRAVRANYDWPRSLSRLLDLIEDPAGVVTHHDARTPAHRVDA
jgi:polysaccharide biosynthesis protein PslH